jgi:hypothetical protein
MSLINKIRNDAKKLKSFVNSKLINTILFDVSLRDGLQSLDISEQEKITTERKKELYNHIN